MGSRNPEQTESAVADYATRWSIQTLFDMFKIRGFCLEATHLTDVQQLSKQTVSTALISPLLPVLQQLKPLTLKNHGRRAKSILRYGFDYLQTLVLNLEQKMDQFLEVLHFLSCT